MIYLASPYSHPDVIVRQNRFENVCRYAAFLMSRGDIVFSPIAHTHPIAIQGSLPLLWSYWKKVDIAFMKCCNRMTILRLDGWKESEGIKEEMILAHTFEMPIDYADLKDCK